MIFALLKHCLKETYKYLYYMSYISVTFPLQDNDSARYGQEGT